MNEKELNTNEENKQPTAPEDALPPEDAQVADTEQAPEEPVAEAEDAEEEQPSKDKKAVKAELKKLRAENTELQSQLKKAQADAEEQKDKYLRTLAEYDNYRKRTLKEREGIYADASADCVKNLLPLFDNLERASKFAESDQAAEGVRMILGTVPDVLQKMNITAFGAPGDIFDPTLHNAVMHVDDEQYGEGEILEVFQCGYRHGDKIIRYAMVKVAN